jgi:hypothetical protein
VGVLWDLLVFGDSKITLGYSDGCSRTVCELLLVVLLRLLLRLFFLGLTDQQLIISKLF